MQYISIYLYICIHKFECICIHTYIQREDRERASNRGREKKREIRVILQPWFEWNTEASEAYKQLTSLDASFKLTYFDYYILRRKDVCNDMFCLIIWLWTNIDSLQVYFYSALDRLSWVIGIDFTFYRIYDTYIYTRMLIYMYVCNSGYVCMHVFTNTHR